MVFFVKKERSGGGGRWEKYEVKIMKDEELGTKGTKGDGAEENDLISALVSNVFIQLNESLMDKTSNSSILDEL